MTRKHRKRFGIFRAIILILIIVLFVIAGFFFIKDKLSLDNKEEVIKENTETILEEEIKVSCNQYDVYFDEDNKLDFNFIIAELNFDTNGTNLHYDLSHLHTGGKIKLSECEYYINKLKSLNYDISKFNLLSTEFSAEGSHLKGNVFIPFVENANTISVFNGEEIKFDLTKNKHNINELLYDIKTEDIKTDKYDISISTSYIDTMFVTADTREEFACRYALAFELYVNSVSSNNVYIENAKFIPEGSVADDYYDCLDEHVDSYRIDNIIGKKLQKGDRYGLFFQIFEDTNTKGTIMIKFSDNDNWMELKEG